METSDAIELSGLCDIERSRALSRFEIIRPFLEDGVPLTRLVRERQIVLRMARRWVERYRKNGLAGLVRKERNDKDERKLLPELQQIIEGLALSRPKLSTATVHRKAVDAARKLDVNPPSYDVVYSLIRKLAPALVTMAHEGMKAYSESFDLVHRVESEAPNAIWQADHTELDILVKDERGNARRPWLTIILDDYSRAVAGFMLSFAPPSAIQTALALRQAIWRKPQPGWHICGIPQVLYTDHGSDFTSQHIEQVAADLKIRLIFSTVGKPRGRGKIERFFASLSQVFLSRLQGSAQSEKQKPGTLTLSELSRELENYLVNQYLLSPHSTTGQAPQIRWEAGGFLRAFDLLHPLAKIRQGLFGETGPDSAGKQEPGRTVVADKQSAEILATALRWCVATDHELLLLGKLYLNPGTGAPGRALEHSTGRDGLTREQKKELQGIYLARCMKTLPDRVIARNGR